MASMYLCTGWGDQSWINFFSFSVYRSPSPIEAYVSPEKSWLVFVWFLAARRFPDCRHHFLQQVLRMYCATSWSHSATMDRRRANWHEALPGFFCLKNAPDRQVQQVQVRQILCQPICWGQNSANFWVVWLCCPVLNLLKDICSTRIRSLDSGDHMPSQKLLVDVGLNH